MRLYLTVDKLHLQKQEMCPLEAGSLNGDDNVPGENEVSTWMYDIMYCHLINSRHAGS